MPKEISDYLNKMSARVPKIKPGRATVEYLTKIQTSTRFWGRWPSRELVAWPNFPLFCFMFFLIFKKCFFP